jgi:hypothetical protein
MEREEHIPAPGSLSTTISPVFRCGLSLLQSVRGDLIPYRAEEMEAHQVSPVVNSPKNQGPELIQPVTS